MKKSIFLSVILLILLCPFFASAQTCDDPISDWIPDFNDPVLTVKTKLIIVQDENGNGNFNATHIPIWMSHINSSLTNLFASVADPIIGGIPQSQMFWYQDTHIRFSLDQSDVKFVQSADHWDPIREFVGDIISTDIINNQYRIKIPYDERNEEALDVMVNYNGSNADKMWMEIRGWSINDGLYTPSSFSMQNGELHVIVDQPLMPSTGQGIADFDCPLTVGEGGNNPHASYICEYGEDQLTHLNILVTGRSFYYPNTPDYTPYNATPRGYGMGGKVVLNDVYEAYLASNNFLPTKKLLAHEIGHAFGLAHTHNTASGACALIDGTDTDNIADTPADYGCGCNPEHVSGQSDYHKDCSNNLMGYNSVQEYISPLQAAKMYKNLNCGLYFLAHPCTDIVVSSTQTIDQATRVCGNLVVEQGVTLTVNSSIHFNKYSKVIIKKGGKLILNAHLSGIGGFWEGVEIEGSSNLDQSASNQGMLVVNQNGWIRNARVGVRNHLLDDQGNILWNTTGGIVQVNSGRFQNNRRHVIFLSYHGTGNTLSASYFDNAQFRLTNIQGCEYDGFAAAEFVSIYDVDGISFINCQFSNFSAPSSSTFNTGTGLSLHTADVTLEESIFRRFNIGLQAVNSSGEVFLSNAFEGNRTAIQLSDSDIVYVKNNTISGPLDPDFGSNATKGIEATNVKRMHLEGNNLDVLTNGIIADNTGETYTSNVSDNVFSNCLVSLVTRNDNSRLFVRCNDFQGGADISTHWINSGTMQDQGTCTPSSNMHDPASNLFTGLTPPNADIFNLGSAFEYVHHSTSGSGYTLSDLSPSSANSSVVLTPCTDITDPFDYNRACVEIYVRSEISNVGALTDNEFAVSIFPNPSNGLVNLDISNQEKGKGDTQVFDISGKLLESISHGELEVGDHRVFLDFEKYAPGAYFIKVTLSETSVTQKLILMD